MYRAFSEFDHRILPKLVLTALILVSSPVFASLDTELWDELLEKAVTRGVVDYSQWDGSTALDTLVQQIAETSTDEMSDAEQLAFYINAYNILAARGILDDGSPSTLLGRYFYFKRDKYVVSDRKISLHQLEHELLRALNEPRIHFAIVCASQSCPILQDKAFRAETLDAQLHSATVEFINDSTRNSFDIENNTATISKIFDWFEEDFVAASGSVQSYISRYLSDREAAERLNSGAFDIEYMSYDWKLNGKR